MSQLALDLIAKEREKKTGFLNLGNCGLTEIPEEVFELDWLIFLSFSPSDKNKGNRNQITQIDKKISRLTKLIFLVLNDNDISDIKQITLCKSIKHLSLKNNKKLKDISPIQNLVNLETLILKGTSIEDKSHLNNLKLLKHLDISELENQTDKTRTPSRLENLKDLEVLKVTLVDTFDFSIFKKLKTLHITYWHCYNYLEDLSIIGKITTLEDLLINYIDQGFGDEDYSKHAMEYRYKGKIKDLSFLKDLTKLKELTLTNHRIKDTEILKNFPQLEKLNLSKNRIINTNGLKELHHLKELKFNSCGLSSLDFISKSKSLQWLEINDNCITDLLPIQELSNLEILEINNNNVSDIQALKNLSLLRFLEIEKNDISDISMAESFKELVLLKAGNNNIVRIEGLKGLTEITILDLSHNLIEDIPKLEHYEKLSYLNLESNNIVDIKNLLSFFQYGKTTYWSNKEYLPRLDDEENFITTDKNNIILIGNPIKNPPIEIVKEGRQAIINYFDQLKVQGEDYLFEAKMIILGESGAGKTTFFRKIKDNNADLPKDKETTLGINSEPWFFEISSEDIDKAIDKPLKNKKAINAIKEQGFRVNRWDFGGQEIYHSTHQFFLSHRSFYVLLADTREQKTDFNYWLNIAEQRSGESPLMVVLNEKHGHTWTIDEYGFKQRFPFYKETYNLNLAEVNDFTKLELLRDKVKDYVLNLPHIGDTLPANWVQIRLNLSSLNEKYISLDKFREICKEHDISKIDDILTMSQYFHDIGVFIHFHNNSILKNRIFLDANWTTETIYDLLNDQQIKDELGRFSKNYVHSIWNDEDCLMIIDELLELLNEFGLAYPVDKNNFIIPQRLSQGKPYEHWQYENEPQLLFSYTFDKFMPKGLMSRLIVALHQYIYDQNLVWLKGVNLKREDAFAEIVEQYGGENRFDIRIAGKDRRDLLITITNAFDKILEDYPKLKYNQKIPCNCDECKSQTDFSQKSFYDYTKLKKRLSKGKKTIECEQTYDDVEIEPMVYDVFGEPTNRNKEIEKLANINENTYKETVKAWLPNYHNLSSDVLKTLIEAEAKYSNTLDIRSNNFNTSIQQYGVAIENELKDIFVNYHTYIWEELSEREINRITPRRGTEHGKFAKCVKDDVIKYQFKEMIEILKKVNIATSDLFNNFKNFLSNKYDTTILIDNAFLDKIDNIRGNHRNEVSHEPTPFNQTETDEFRIIARDIIKKLVDAKK